jgi:anti-sigma-K factor RskA
MTCHELSDEYELYALGVLEDPERGELQAHLARNCDICSPAVRSAAIGLADFASLAPPAEPPKRLRARVLAAAGVEPRFGWSWMRMLSAALAACVLFGLAWFVNARPLRQAMQQAQRSETEAARLKEVLALLNSPETIVRVSSEGSAQPPQGKVFLNPNQGVLLLASNLPPAPAGKIYEMWVIPAAGNPVPAGLFQTERNGTAALLRKGPVDVTSTAAVAVTLEAAGGAPQPTSQPLIVAPLKKG